VFVAEAQLSGLQEVPPILATSGSGLAIYRLSPDGSTIHFILVVTNLTTPPVAAHIHAPAPPGVNAAVVAFEFPPNSTSSCSSTTQFLLRCEGDISSANLVGPLAGKSIADLVALMAAGQTYTNAHTTRHPGGEVRGQNVPIVDIAVP
jgi:hypothetical protein